MKLITTIALLCFTSISNAHSASEEPIFLLCSESSDTDYEYLIFMITEDGWLYDAINTSVARLETYGNTNYSYQTLSNNFSNNRYYSESWVHINESKFNLLTTSNFSREFSVDFTSETFREIDSGVANKNLAGGCSIKSAEYLSEFTTTIEHKFHSWSRSNETE
tara:strand:- start:524 stop:1015 length:492 start_codon:yes stop_codon:yes gene_type:complete